MDWQAVLRPTALQAFRVHKNLCANVATLRLFPGITTASVKAFLASPLQGVVLSTYGAGNCPSRPDLLDAFRQATDRGCVIVNVTQCYTGAVVGSICKLLCCLGVLHALMRLPRREWPQTAASRSHRRCRYDHRGEHRHMCFSPDTQPDSPEL